MLNAGHMTRVYGDRIIKAILGVSVAFADLKDTATLQKSSNQQNLSNQVLLIANSMKTCLAAVVTTFTLVSYAAGRCVVTSVA